MDLIRKMGFKVNAMPLSPIGGDLLTLIEDTRNQIGEHKNIEDYCRKMGITMVRQKLDVGDYMFPDEFDENMNRKYPRISVDTKQDLLELCKNVMSNDHRRFRNECQLAKDLGIQLIVLVEEPVPYGRVDLWKVPIWKSSNQWHRFGEPMTRVDPGVFRKALMTMSIKYGVKFRFCTKKQCPSRVIKYLKGEFQ